MFVLDTNIVSELRRPQPHPAVTDWMSKHEGAQLKVAAVTVGEIQVGVERTRMGDPAKAAEIESWLVELIQALIVLPMTAETFRIWAKFMHGKQPHLSGDAMIAATAAQHGFTVVTRNIRDFEQFPCRSWIHSAKRAVEMTRASVIS